MKSIGLLTACVLSMFWIGCASSSSDGSADGQSQAGADTSGNPADAVDPAFMNDFHNVRPGLYRGPHPNLASLKYIQSLGVKTILSLQQPGGSVIEGDKAADVAEEPQDVSDLGMEYISVPMTSWSSHDTYDAAWAQIEPILQGVSSSAALYVHCAHGHDRTGLVIALDRVFLENMNPTDAHQEMMNLGHSALLIKVDDYFWFKTIGNPLL